MGGVTGFWLDRKTRGFEKVWWSRGVRSASGRWTCAARVVGRRGGRGVVYWSGEGRREGGCGGPKERDPVEDNIEGSDVAGLDALDGGGGRRALVRCDGKVGRRKGF